MIYARESDFQTHFLQISFQPGITKRRSCLLIAIGQQAGLLCLKVSDHWPYLGYCVILWLPDQPLHVQDRCTFTTAANVSTKTVKWNFLQILDLPYQLENTVRIRMYIRINNWWCHSHLVCAENRYHWRSHLHRTAAVWAMERHERQPVATVQVDQVARSRACVWRLRQALREFTVFLPEKPQGRAAHRIDKRGSQKCLHRLLSPLLQTPEQQQNRNIQGKGVWRPLQNLWGLCMDSNR